VLLLKIFSYHFLQVRIPIHIYFISAFRAIQIWYTAKETPIYHAHSNQDLLICAATSTPNYSHTDVP
jgi:hypothetical protein